MPLIELLRPQQRDWLRKLRRRIANPELMRRLRADLNRKLLCPGVDLPIEAGTCGRPIVPESPVGRASSATTAASSCPDASNGARRAARRNLERRCRNSGMPRVSGPARNGQSRSGAR